jgi:hypothetical protein
VEWEMGGVKEEEKRSIEEGECLLQQAIDNPNTTQTLEYTKNKYNCKGNLTILRRILYLDLAKGNPK